MSDDSTAQKQKTKAISLHTNIQILGHLATEGSKLIEIVIRIKVSFES